MPDGLYHVTSRGNDNHFDVELPRTTMAIERIDEAVAQHYGVSPCDLADCYACDRAAKFVAVELACQLTGG